jgi:hypothetical protein
MLRKVSDHDNIEWLNLSQESDSQESDLGDSGIIHAENESTECPSGQTSIKPTEFNIKEAAKKEAEVTEETVETIEEVEAVEEVSEEVTAASVDWEKIAMHKKLEDGSFDPEDGNTAKSVRNISKHAELSKGAETSYGGRFGVAPGQFSMFDSFDAQIDKIADSGKEIREIAESKEEKRANRATEWEQDVLTSLEGNLANIMSQHNQTSTTPDSVEVRGDSKLPADQISMFDGEGAAFAEEKTAREESIEAAQKRKQDIQRESSEDKSWEQVSTGTKATDKSEDLINRMGEVFGDPFGLDDLKEDE